MKGDVNEKLWWGGTVGVKGEWVVSMTETVCGVWRSIVVENLTGCIAGRKKN